jgi:hypothetical protein
MIRRHHTIVREALAPYLADLPANSIAKGVRLQIGGGVDQLFRILLTSSDINRFETKYTTVSALCQRWGREVEANPEVFKAELDALPAQPRATVRISAIEAIAPTMADVMSIRSRYPRVSTFPGWRFIGRYHRLGWKALMGEFAPEAARGRLDFRCPVDPRNIRDISE